MNLILWIIFGAVVGFIANLLTGGKRKSRGCITSIIIGIIGSFIGGTAVHFLQTGNFDIIAAGGFDLASMVVSVIGAVILIIILD